MRKYVLEVEGLETFTFESKLYVASAKKRNLFAMILNVILAIFAAATIIITIMEGFQLHLFGELCVAFLVVSYFNSNGKGGYQFSLADMQISSDAVNILYHNVNCDRHCVDITVTIPTDHMQQIEYSKTLNAIRFTGKIEKHIDGEFQREILKDWVVYLDNNTYNGVETVQRTVECYLGKTIAYMD